MYYVDHEITAFLENGRLHDGNLTAIDNGDTSCVTNIGYDLRAERFIKNKESCEKCTLLPGESVFVQSTEAIRFDKNTCGVLALKNSRIRMGLTMDAPVYQPGHYTYIYFRLTNISSDELKLEQGEKYAMLMFEQLHAQPETPYNGPFQEEFSYRGLSDYTSQYNDQIRSIDKKVKNIESIEKSIYGNVITILTIFVAIFTLLNVNINLSTQDASGRLFLIFNMAILGGVSFLAVLLNELLNHTSSRKHWLWIVPAVCFAVMALGIFL